MNSALSSVIYFTLSVVMGVKGKVFRLGHLTASNPPGAGGYFGVLENSASAINIAIDDFRNHTGALTEHQFE